VIEELPFGRTGHSSTRTIFGAAALGAMRQERADQVLDTLLEHGVNHIDTAAAYGDSELRIGPWMRRYRDRFFLATKTGERTYAAAREQLHRSLERLEVERVDLIQMHNLVEPDEQETALGPRGALEALVEARDQGLVRFIGVTGHGTRAAEMHRKSLERFEFDSVLLPCNYAMLRAPDYAADFGALLELCAARNVAVQTIKSVARRRWREDETGPRFSWYEPLRDPERIGRAVRWVLGHRGIFLITSSDATILPHILKAASEAGPAPSEEEMERDTGGHGIEPIFVRGVSDQI
jgi:aryl-alcohol dehydrogenase-like predicted oxidoreductase